MNISQRLYAQIIEHAVHDQPFEACGLLAGNKHGEVTHVMPCLNMAMSTTRYEIDGLAQMRLQGRMADQGLELLAVYHSHPSAPPVPSETDILGWRHGATLMVIVGPRHRGRLLSGVVDPDVRAFRMGEKGYSEIPIIITGDSPPVG